CCVTSKPPSPTFRAEGPRVRPPPLGLSYRKPTAMNQSMDNQGHIQRQLALFAEHVAATKDWVLDSWRERVCADPALSIASRLSRDHFVNHMPDVLDTLCIKLRAWPAP